jgi:hypothetical protein
MRLLLAIADENKNGKISWREFIPVGIDAIKTFLARNKILAKQQMYAKEVNPETLQLVFAKTALMTSKHLTRKFKMFDFDKETKENSGFVSFKVM